MIAFRTSSRRCCGWKAPIKSDFRLTRVATTLGGVAVPAGTTVMLLPGAANRDPRHFDCPAELRVDRPNARQNVAFARGVHSCPGGPLARIEGRVTIERILDRLKDIRLDEDTARTGQGIAVSTTCRSTFFAGWKHCTSNSPHHDDGTPARILPTSARAKRTRSVSAPRAAGQFMGEVIRGIEDVAGAFAFAATVRVGLAITLAGLAIAGQCVEFGRADYVAGFLGRHHVAQNVPFPRHGQPVDPRND